MSVSRDFTPFQVVSAAEAGKRKIKVAEFLRQITGNRPHLLVVLATLLEFAISYWSAYLLRFEFAIPPSYSLFMICTVPYVLLIKLVVFYANGVYRILWAYVGLKDIYKILYTSVISAGLISITNAMLFPCLLVPRSVLVVDCVLTFLSVGGFYGILRSVREANARTEGKSNSTLQPVFVIGAGDEGEALLRDLQRNAASTIRVAGFLDDDKKKHGLSLRGVKVLGGIEDAARLAKDFEVRSAFIAIPSANTAVIATVVERLLDAKLSMKILPALRMMSPEGGIAMQLRDVSIEDLLRREPVHLDMGAIGESLRGKVVMVTGAAGSIGSELSRQILGYLPAQLIALDIAESPLHALLLELKDKSAPGKLVAELADITDVTRLRGVFDKHRPAVVFHAAALKHVPMMEEHPREAVRVNIQGTRTVAEAARDFGTESFILISTDKAVNPSSVMGGTKRIAELILRNLSKAPGTRPRYMAVRFGNVLGSNGSVVPIFKAQLSKGGPLTVTHPDMQRYFMSTSEAVQLVLQASILGKGGEVFVLDMGEPVYIKDLAEDLIRLSGLEPNVDISIEYTGIRPGEKLFEELRFDSENLMATIHPKIACLVPKDSTNELEIPAQLLARIESGGAKLNEFLPIS